MKLFTSRKHINNIFHSLVSGFLFFGSLKAKSDSKEIRLVESFKKQVCFFILLSAVKKSSGIVIIDGES
jgi:hypothetical protein